MAVKTLSIQINTRGNTDVIDITHDVMGAILESGISNGIVMVFTPSATSAITTIEYEEGCLRDLEMFFDRIIPPTEAYAHNARWGDKNGHSHLRAALIGASFSAPIVDGRLVLGTWQQIIFIDFDIRPRRRELVVQVVGD